MVGAEYGFRSYFMVRAGLVYEEDGFKSLAEGRTNAYTGPTAGATVMVPLGTSGGSIDIDYSYRHSNPFDGTHSVGLRINL